MKKIEAIDKKLPFTVPAGYFDGLQERVMARCVAPTLEEKKVRSLWEAIRPQLAFAAGFALLVGLGSLTMRLTTSGSTNEIALTSNISQLDIDAYVEQQHNLVVNSEEDSEAIVEYLLSDSNVGYLAVGL